MKHTELIAGLREAADYLESHPDLPEFSIAWLHSMVEDKDELRAAARAMGSFAKVTDDHYFKLVHHCGPLKIEVGIPRESVCKKRVVWDCPEDLETLLGEKP